MQTSYSNTPGEAFAGLLYDTGYRDIISRINATKQLHSVVVTTAANAEIFTVTIDGTGYPYTSDGSATKKEISDGLKALIEAGSADVTCTTFTSAVTDDSFYIENNSYDTEKVISITNPATGVLTLTELVDHEDIVQFGAVCVESESAAAGPTGRRECCRLPRLATDFSNRKVLGVAIADTSLVTRSGSPQGGYDAGTAVPLLRKGRIWMYVEDVASVAVGGLVYVRHVAGSTESLGAIRAVDDGSDTEVLDAQQAQFTGQTVAALNLAVVEWNLP